MRPQKDLNFYLMEVFQQGSDMLRLGVFRGSLWPEGRGHMGHRPVALRKPLWQPRQVERKAELGSTLCALGHQKPGENGQGHGRRAVCT